MHFPVTRFALSAILAARCERHKAALRDVWDSKSATETYDAVKRLKYVADEKWWGRVAAYRELSYFVYRATLHLESDEAHMGDLLPVFDNVWRHVKGSVHLAPRGAFSKYREEFLSAVALRFEMAVIDRPEVIACTLANVRSASLLQ